MNSIKDSTSSYKLNLSPKDIKKSKLNVIKIHVH